MNSEDLLALAVDYHFPLESDKDDTRNPLSKFQCPIFPTRSPGNSIRVSNVTRAPIIAAYHPKFGSKKGDIAIYCPTDHASHSEMYREIVAKLTPRSFIVIANGHLQMFYFLVTQTLEFKMRLEEGLRANPKKKKGVPMPYIVQFYTAEGSRASGTFMMTRDGRYGRTELETREVTDLPVQLVCYKGWKLGSPPDPREAKIMRRKTIAVKEKV